MQIRWPVATAVILAGLVLLAEQTAEKYQARLATVAMDASMRSTIAGAGSASGALSANHLTISGTFEGLRSPAIAAKIHRGRVTGVRGPAIFDLTVSAATSGDISGVVELTADQIDDLRKGRLYLQIDSERAREGNLWGWFLRSADF
jgi:hypothetical protein